MELPELPNIMSMAGLAEPVNLTDVVHAADLDRDRYIARLQELQLELVRIQQRVGDYGMRVIIVFEGMDAAGKGGAIKRLTQFLDPRGYRVHSLGAPSTADMNHHYLRRFWMRLPKRGRISVFDDYSWYGRMLLESVEQMCLPEDYLRAPQQLREFERVLVEEGYLIIKFWIQVSRDEQFKRFKRRLNNPYKAWKLTPEDWRNRQLYTQYVDYAQRMIEATHAPYAPWIVVAGDAKLSARVEVLQTVARIVANYPVQSTLYTQRYDYLRWLADHPEDYLDDDD